METGALEIAVLYFRTGSGALNRTAYQPVVEDMFDSSRKVLLDFFNEINLNTVSYGESCNHMLLPSHNNNNNNDILSRN